MAYHFRNQERGRVVEGRRLKYRGSIEENWQYLDNLKGIENIESLN